MRDYMHPGYRKLYPIQTVLRDLAAQEGCDGEPYDAMVFAADRIEQLEKELNICRMAQVVMENGIAEAEKERDEALNQLDSARHSVDVLGKRVADLMAKLTTCEEIGRAAEEDASQLREKLRARTAERNHANDVTDAAIEEVNRLKALLAKAVEALKEALYFLSPTESDMEKKAGIYRIVTTLAEIEGEKG